MCIPQWVGDGWCDDGIVYHVDCTKCEHFIDADGVFDGGDCDEEARTSTMVRATKSLEKAVGRSRLSKQEIKSYMSKMAKTRKSAETAVGKGKTSSRINSQKWPTRKSAEKAVAQEALVNGEDYCESDSMLRNEEGCKASSCCHWNTWEEGEASFNGEGRCWSSIGTAMCTGMSEGNR
jgi:CCR4-NOT transcriptional regulation complex NOT5 subunit